MIVCSFILLFFVRVRALALLLGVRLRFHVFVSMRVCVYFSVVYC